LAKGGVGPVTFNMLERAEKALSVYPQGPELGLTRFCD